MPKTPLRWGKFTSNMPRWRIRDGSERFPFSTSRKKRGPNSESPVGPPWLVPNDRTVTSGAEI
eukprot:scaffold106211_cov44-Attheya_sp.AAC.2